MLPLFLLPPRRTTPRACLRRSNVHPAIRKTCFRAHLGPLLQPLDSTPIGRFFQNCVSPRLVNNDAVSPAAFRRSRASLRVEIAHAGFFLRPRPRVFLCARGKRAHCADGDKARRQTLRPAVCHSMLLPRFSQVIVPISIFSIRTRVSILAQLELAKPLRSSYAGPARRSHVLAPSHSTASRRAHGRRHRGPAKSAIPKGC